MAKPKKSNKGAGDNVVAVNRRARHDYFIEERIEAGLALQGWEVRSLRSGRAQIAEAYVVLRRGEAWLLGAHVPPLPSASTHVVTDATRTRKLLIHRHEIDRLIGATERRGYTVVPLQLYWQRGRAKLEIGLAKGKRKHDKREAEKEKDWERDRQRLLRNVV
ncbi:MAG: SsrA-binding protein SmpB [Halofilum sp. (in: g-proteobacteria)]